MNRLDADHHRWQRSILGVCWKDRITNEEVRASRTYSEKEDFSGSITVLGLVVGGQWGGHIFSWGHRKTQAGSRPNQNIYTAKHRMKPKMLNWIPNYYLILILFLYY